AGRALHPDWIPLTKVMPPQVGEDILLRPHLSEQLVRAVKQKRLILISAPAGSGKTITAASLQRAAELPLVWLALDEEDDDLISFMWLLATALRRRFSPSGAKAMSLLSDLPNPAGQFKRVLGVLINELLAADPEPFAFVVDDYHLVKNPAVHQALAHLLDHLPPPWHFVIATRREPPLPLARLRARGQLAVFDLDALRFKKEDVQTLFRERLALSLPPDHVQTLQMRTEGWIAGIRLVANTLQTIEDGEKRRAFVEQVAAADRHVFDLLAEEVLQRQPESLQAFLRETSILRELTPALCEAVTGRADAGGLLDEAVRRNLFLSAVGPFESAVSPVYRYHDLFARFLRHRLAQREDEAHVRELHRRAAVAETTPGRVVRHYLAAEAWDAAGEAVADYGRQMLAEGQSARVAGWLSAFPEDFLRQRPWLNYLKGMCYADGGDFVRAAPLLEQARRQFGEKGVEEGETATMVSLVYASIARHDFARAAELIDKVLARPLSPYERVRAHINRAWLMLYQNRWDVVDSDIAEATEITLTSEDVGAINVMAQQLTAPLVLGRRGIGPVRRYHETILAGLGDEPSVVRAGTVAALSNIKLLQGEIEEAVKMAREARAMSVQFGGLVWMDMAWDQVLLADALIGADYATFEGRWQARLAAYEETAARQWLIVYLYLLARAQWMKGDEEQVRALARRAEATEIALEPPESLIARQMFAALLALQTGEYRKAETLLLDAVRGQERARHVRIFFDARFMLAHLYLAWERPDDALAILQPLLATLSQEGAPGLALQEGPYVLPLLELAAERGIEPAFVQNLLRLFDRKREIRPIPIPGTDESLTPREVEVMSLLMTGATNKEIAEELVITPRTARAHVSNILGKLDVSSRTEAVARAHELSLLGR
ncbi:MAG: LuxR C-terminal-related transcriptional regulator, partial [Candidatus Promineifilaceae bacterium]|nr:LuxR C-terminal-related transcriptional regulator [Candidatus Promineifilaceae bacterium]